MNTRVHSKLALLLVVGFWLITSQILVTSHEAVHSSHVHAQFCDDLGAAGASLFAITNSPRLVNVQFSAVDNNTHAVIYFFPLPARPYQSRAPPDYSA